MTSKSGECITQTLREFVNDVGIPDNLICDLASEQDGTHTPMIKEFRQLRIKLHSAEKGHSIKNHHAETEITRELKRRWKARMVERQVPSRLWDYGIIYVAEILSITARLTTGCPGIEEVNGDTIDISEWLDFEFYDYVWYWDEKKVDMTDDQRLIGRWLGIAHCIGSYMFYWILTKAGHVIARSTVQHVITSDMSQKAIQERVKAFDMAIELRLADANLVQEESGVFYMDDEDTDEQNEMLIPTDAEYGDMITEPRPEVEEVDVYDKYLNAEFIIHRADGDAFRARVTKRAREDTGEWIGRSHTNPVFDTREYGCVLDDSTMERYTANIIAENLYSQCDSEGFLVLDKIIDHAKDNSVILIADGYTTSTNGN
jgi:hypothetical protein